MMKITQYSDYSGDGYEIEITKEQNVQTAIK